MRKPEPWPTTWMKLAHTIAERSKDPSTRVGAVIVARDGKTLLHMGYNGPSEYISDSKIDWNNREERLLLTSHAESNALWHAAETAGGGLVCATLFVTAYPCSQCVKEAVRAKLDTIVYDGNGPQAKMCDAADRGRSERVAYLGGLDIASLKDYLRRHYGD